MNSQGIQSRLLWKLLGIHALVIGVVILIVWLAIDYLAADYFMVLMKKYNISPTEVHAMFLTAAHRYLIWASLAALAVAAILSILLTRKVLSPLFEMAEITQKIASGDYSSRLKVFSEDEISQLATSFNQMADSLQRVEQLRKNMVVGIAHELRTPLTNIRGYLEALKDGVVSPSQKTLESLHEETLRLIHLTEELFQLARVDASRGTLRLKEEGLQKLILKALDLFHPRFAAKRITVETDLSTIENPIQVDSEKLLQVLRNLLQNAWQYTPPDGRVRISARRSGGKVKVVFANTSEGIAEKDLPFVFEPFYRGEKSRSREHGGIGIGLAIVKMLVEAHGGEVGAESTPGETFIWFTLPA